MNLSLLYKLTCWPIIQKVRSYIFLHVSTAYKYSVSESFKSNFLVLFTFPSRYFFSLSVIKLYLGLEDGSPFFKLDDLSSFTPNKYKVLLIN